ncbi:MAG: helix-turn-helix domain-containing protein, partial [Stenotrophomonas chelatiphaga]
MTLPDRPTRLTDRKRAAILDAAVAEFRAFGFAGTSMDRIAATAEVSKRTVYNHFASKDELFTAILWQLFEASQAL